VGLAHAYLAVLFLTASRGTANKLVTHFEYLLSYRLLILSLTVYAQIAKATNSRRQYELGEQQVAFQ